MDPHAVDALIREHAGETTVLHYNAGVLRYDGGGKLVTGSIEELPLGEVVADLTINLSSAISAARAVLPAMKARGAGTILFTGGGISLSPYAGLLPLSAGKAGIRNIAEALATDLRPQGIRVGTVTVSDAVEAGSRHCVEIAEHFWDLHCQPLDSAQWEIVHRAL